jgi:hypothetical protein
MLKFPIGDHFSDEFRSPQTDDDDPLSAWGQLMQVSAAGAKPLRPRGERRIYPRIIFSVPLKVHHLRLGGISSSRGISLDLSEGGVGALVQIDLIVGEAVEIDLQLPSESLSTVAIVRYCSRTRAGFEFVGLLPEERNQIQAAVSRK